MIIPSTQLLGYFAGMSRTAGCKGLAQASLIHPYMQNSVLYVQLIWRTHVHLVRICTQLPKTRSCHTAWMTPLTAEGSIKRLHIIASHITLRAETCLFGIPWIKPLGIRWQSWRGSYCSSCVCSCSGACLGDGAQTCSYILIQSLSPSIPSLHGMEGCA